MRIAIGGDHRGHDAIVHLADHLRGMGHEVQVLGPLTREPCDYTDGAFAVANAVADQKADFGVLVCGTGIGTCISANKVRGIRAALVHDEITAQMSRSHNDANVVCLSADLLGIRLMDKIIDTCLTTTFSAGRHMRRVRKLAAIERGEDPAKAAE
ncbi:MAG: ribose 5-phosphate isomerase B [Phycisphaerales bacterium]|nr:ribose 5-phosphate isomerase B [Phycisphaerales bacterium]